MNAHANSQRLRVRLVNIAMGIRRETHGELLPQSENWVCQAKLPQLSQWLVPNASGRNPIAGVATGRRMALIGSGWFVPHAESQK